MSALPEEGNGVLTPVGAQIDVAMLVADQRRKALEDAVNVIVALVEAQPSHLKDLSLDDAWDVALYTAATNVRALIPDTPRMELTLRGEVIPPTGEEAMADLGTNKKYVLSGFEASENGILVTEIDITRLAEKLEGPLKVYFGEDDDLDGSYPLSEVGEVVLKERYGVDLDPALDWFLDVYADEQEDPPKDAPCECEHCGHPCPPCPPCPDCPPDRPLSWCEAINEFFRELAKVFFGP